MCVLYRLTVFEKQQEQITVWTMFSKHSTFHTTLSTEPQLALFRSVLYIVSLWEILPLNTAILEMSRRGSVAGIGRETENNLWVLPVIVDSEYYTMNSAAV